jgi:hypothetical protein
MSKTGHYLTDNVFSLRLSGLKNVVNKKTRAVGTLGHESRRLPAWRKTNPKLDSEFGRFKVGCQPGERPKDGRESGDRLFLSWTRYSRARAILRARSSSSTLKRASEPTKRVSCVLRRLTRLSHRIQLSCFRPSSIPTETWVEKPWPRVRMGGTDDGGESGIDQVLPAHYDEAAVEFRIVAGMMNAINLASPYLFFVGYSGLA